MRLILEVASGADTGRKVWLTAGQSVDVGRTGHAMFTVCGDSRMSGLHFSVSCDRQSCRLLDMDSEHGTRLNGDLVEQSAVRDGDRITAGNTVFVVQLEGVDHQGDAELDCAPYETTEAPIAVHVVGSWQFRTVPDGWQPLEGRGLAYQGVNHEIGHVAVTEFDLEGEGLIDHVARRMSLMRGIPGLAVTGPECVSVDGADESLQALVEYRVGAGRDMAQRILYSIDRNRSGIAILTSLVDVNDELRLQLNEIAGGLRFHRSAESFSEAV